MPLIISSKEKQDIHNSMPPKLPEDWMEAHGADAPLYWSESKPIACALLDEVRIQAVFDVTPDSGALMEAAMTRGIQYYGACPMLSSHSASVA